MPNKITKKIRKEGRKGGREGGREERNRTLTPKLFFSMTLGKLI